MHRGEPTDRQFQLLAAAVAHDLRTPLSALSGEVELALRRERSPAAYREALSRIADRVTELLELSSDLADLAQPAAPGPRSAPALRLEATLAAARERYCTTARGAVVVDIDTAVTVAGDEKRLVRALTLLIDHAVRHRGQSTGIFLRCQAPAEGRDAEWVDLLLSAAPSGFAAGAWLQLRAEPAAEERAYASGLIRLRTAAHLVGDCGGSLHVTSTDGVESLCIRLRCA